ncbi:MAG: sensor histidine kinase, partial [Spirochaetia bacterium]|nr:sensor histidine kinase [Spirochaetia bacterium]
QRLSISSLPPFAAKKQIVYNKEVMESAFRELLINAMKYSEKADSIYVIFFMKDSYLEIKILNPAYKNQDDSIGITGVHENMIFEPFYRMSTVSHEGYSMEEFGAGIGLTVVKRVIENHGADISIYTLKNHTENGNERDVSVSIRFPYVENSNHKE